MKKELEGQFAAYKDFRRLRGVLKKISFSENFTPKVLDAMIHLTAPPAVAKPEPVGRTISPTYEEAPAEETLFEKAAPRGEGKPTPARDANRMTIGGIELVKIPKGSFLMGSKDDNELTYDSEKPQHSVDIPYDFWMARFILTNELYAQHLGDKKHPVSDWKKKRDHPVVNVSWDDAMAYCKWFNENFKSELGDLLLRLPTEAEWEKAARGAYANEWPWGNEFDPKKCNSSEGGIKSTTPVGAYSSLGGDSPYGCADVAGNVWEWTHTLFMKYPYEVNDGREAEDIRERRVLRGGSFLNDRRLARCAYRYYDYPSSRNLYLGFRVCVLPHHISGI